MLTDETYAEKVVRTSAPGVNDFRENKALDILEIQKLMSLRAYYQSAGRHDLAFELYSRSADDICWGENGAFWLGREKLREFYVTMFENIQSQELDRLSRIYPEVKSNHYGEKLAASPFGIHTITTPIVEISGDGMTAKGLFYTPGALGFVGERGELVGYWMWERYGIDFVREDGRWRFWHIHIYTDFAVCMGENFAKTASAGCHMDKGVLRPPGGPEPDVVQRPYSGWCPTAAKRLYPLPPEPYFTFSETFSYGPERDDINVGGSRADAVQGA